MTVDGEAGTYEVAVGGKTAGTVPVEDEETPSPTVTPHDGRPEFGFAVGLIALATLVGAI